MGKVGSDLKALFCYSPPATDLRRSMKVSPFRILPVRDLLIVDVSALFSLTSTSSNSALISLSSSNMHSSANSSSAAISLVLADGFWKFFLKFLAGGLDVFLCYEYPLANKMWAAASAKACKLV